MKIRHVACALALTLAPLAVQAAPAPKAANFDYTYVEGGYADFDPGSQDGLWVGGRYGITPEIHVLGEFYSLDDLDLTEFGVGYHMPIAQKLDLYADAKFVDLDFDDGFGLTGGVRFAATPEFELGGGINYYNLTDSETQLFMNAAYTVGNNIAVILEIEDGDLFDKTVLGVRIDL